LLGNPEDIVLLLGTDAPGDAAAEVCDTAGALAVSAELLGAEVAVPQLMVMTAAAAVIITTAPVRASLNMLPP
jgi:hypothetical protein